MATQIHYHTVQNLVSSTGREYSKKNQTIYPTREAARQAHLKELTGGIDYCFKDHSKKPAQLSGAFLLAKEKGSTAVNALPHEGGEDVASILPLVYHRKMNPPFRSRSSTGRHTA